MAVSGSEPANEASRSRLSHPARWIAVSVGLVVLVLAVVLAFNVGTDPTAQQHQSTLVGRTEPSFGLPTLGGQHVSNTSLAGKAVIINFWNTWCIPCRQELPALKAFYQGHANDTDFAMVGIVRDDTRSAVGPYVAHEKMHWIIAFDPGSQAALDFGTRGQPETFAITPDGQVVGFQFGPATVRGLEEMLASARAEPQATRN